MNLGRNITYESLLSQSVSDRTSFKCQLWCVWKKKFNGEIIFHCRKWKIVLLQVKDLIKVSVKLWDEKIFCTFVSCTRHPFEGHNIVHEDVCVTVLQTGTNWKFIFPWREINWRVLQVPKAHFKQAI